VWHPYPGVPGIPTVHNGEYRHQRDWFRNFIYEQERGLDFTEDLASPGIFRWDLSAAQAIWILAAEGFDNYQLPEAQSAAQIASTFRAADSYLVKRGTGKTVVAGYPWFTDWGRDTFISLRGLCLGTGRLDEARDILLEWSHGVSEGMLLNLFPDQGDHLEHNSVDAALWYIIAVHDFLAASRNKRGAISSLQQQSLHKAVDTILTGYSQGTRFGKPVEIQALWLNALWIGSHINEMWKEPFARGHENFGNLFWNHRRGCLYDVVDADHQPGKNDASLRPNQIFAIGGLPIMLIDGGQAKAVVDVVTRCLWTPLGLRSLGPEVPGYAVNYEGGVRERDGAYHQGTVWPWLIGPFVEAWGRVNGDSVEAKNEPRARFLKPIPAHLDEAGIGHVSEIVDAEPPHTPRGCPFQAWSLVELLRLERSVLALSIIE
jgi:glycogen debranching enzyme